METFVLARALHVLAIVIWIGGVFMVTTVIIPAIKKKSNPEEQLKDFENIEGRFSIFARIATLLAGISGFYMLYVLDAWDRYLNPSFWWLHAMTLVWLIFTFILFIAEPFILPKYFKQYIHNNPQKAFSIMGKVHWVLLIVSIITVLGSVAGAHGWSF
jgi:uncharacterized membrane protein